MIGSGCGKDMSVREFGMAKESSGTEGWGLRTKAPHGVEYQWIDMLIYGVLMMTYPLMAMDVDNEGVCVASTKHQAPSKSDRIQGGGSRARVAFASGMVDGASKVGYAMPSIVVVMHKY